MRAIIFALALTVASVASAQYPGGVQVLGPYQPSPWGGYYYANPSVPRYTGPMALQYGWGYDDPYTARQIRRIRWQLESDVIIRPRLAR